jgi:hypothetical protein
MTNEHPITPPPELVHQWAYALSSRSDQSVFTEVAQWGAGQEREAMLAELKALHLPDGYAAKLRAARRPKPPSLKEQLIGIQPTPTSPSSLRTMQNDLPENIYSVDDMPTKLQANNKGQVLWYANGHGWYISKWNLGYMSQTTHWTYMPEDLDIPLDEKVLKQEAFAAWRSGNVSFVHMNERERSIAWQAFNAGADALKEINSEPGPPRWIDDTRRLTLVDGVADAIETADGEGLTNMTWNYHARAAIREVAARINERQQRTMQPSTADEVVSWLRNEADR